MSASKSKRIAKRQAKTARRTQTLQLRAAALREQMRETAAASLANHNTHVELGVKAFDCQECAS